MPRIAYDHGAAHMQARVKVRIKGVLVDTTIGRMLVGDLLPPMIPYSLVNKELSKKELAFLIDYTYRHGGTKETVILADQSEGSRLRACHPGWNFHLHQRHENSGCERKSLSKMWKEKLPMLISSIPTV